MLYKKGFNLDLKFAQSVIFRKKVGRFDIKILKLYKILKRLRPSIIKSKNKESLQYKKQ